MIDVTKIKTTEELLRKAKWLEGKTLSQITREIENSDEISRVITKAGVGYVIEAGFFGIKRNNDARPDIPHLGVEIKTCPLKYNKNKTRISVKEPLSLNIIDYFEEEHKKNIIESSLYKKNKKILFVFYLHDKTKQRSEYIVKYIFLWEMTEAVINELNPDYIKIISMIKLGKAHEIHQNQHEFLTLCPKHGGKFKDPNCHKSKRSQPHTDVKAEVRAFRLKNKYVNLIICRQLNKILEKGGWAAD